MDSRAREQEGLKRAAKREKEQRRKAGMERVRGALFRKDREESMKEQEERLLEKAQKMGQDWE